jgi:hypothetical protein
MANVRSLSIKVRVLMNLFSDDIFKLRTIVEQHALGSTERVNDILYRWNAFVSSSAVDINNSNSVYGWMVDLEAFISNFSGSLFTLLNNERRDLDTIYRVGPISGAAANAVWVVLKPTLDIINKLYLLPQGKANQLYDFRKDSALEYLLSMDVDRTLGEREDAVNFVSIGSFNTFAYDSVADRILFTGLVNAQDELVGLNSFGEGAEVLLRGGQGMNVPFKCQGSVVLLFEIYSTGTNNNSGRQVTAGPAMVQSAGIPAIDIAAGAYTILVPSTEILQPGNPHHLILTVTDGTVLNFNNNQANSLLYVSMKKLYSYDNAVTFTLREYLLGAGGWDISTSSPRWMIFADFNLSGGGSLIGPAMLAYGNDVGTAFTLNYVEMFSVEAWRKFFEGFVPPNDSDIYKLNYFRQFYRLLQTVYYGFLASDVDDFY